MKLSYTHRGALRLHLTPVTDRRLGYEATFVHPLHAQRFSWPGGYPLMYVCLDTGDVFCPKCATLERFRTDLAKEVQWEGQPVCCASCNEPIDVAYPEPEDEER